MIDMTVGDDNSGAAYRPLDVEAVVQYMAACPPLDAAVASESALEAREVGDGNLNLVFIVSSKAGSSAVLKQALPYVRLVGESWPLTTARNTLERRAYAVYDRIVSDLVPRLYHGDDALALFIMEDLSRLEIVRRGHVQGRIFPRLAQDIGRFCAETLLRTSDFYLASAEKKALAGQFINPELCKITEDLAWIIHENIHRIGLVADGGLAGSQSPLWAPKSALRPLQPVYRGGLFSQMRSI